MNNRSAKTSTKVISHVGNTISADFIMLSKLKNITALILIFVCSHFILSCEANDNNEYGPIESDILFTLAPDSIDGLGTSGDPALYLKTEKDYSCFNYEIGYKENVQTNRIDIDIEGIHLPNGICATAMGPARAKIPIGNTTGEFNLRFTYDSATDNHVVSLSDSSIVVVSIDTNFTRYVEYIPGEWW